MTPKAYRLIKELKGLSGKEQQTIAKVIIEERLVDIATLLVLYVSKLQSDYDNAANDVVRVAEAGATLSEKTMRSVTGLGGRSARLNSGMPLALVRCLLEAGAHYGSEYGTKLREAIDITEMNGYWYEQAWQPKGKVYPIKPTGE